MPRSGPATGNTFIQMHVVKANVIEPIIRVIPRSDLWTEHLLDECGLAPSLYQSQRGVMPLFAGGR